MTGSEKADLFLTLSAKNVLTYSSLSLMRMIYINRMTVKTPDFNTLKEIEQLEWLLVESFDWYRDGDTAVKFLKFETPLLEESFWEDGMLHIVKYRADRTGKKVKLSNSVLNKVFGSCICSTYECVTGESFFNSVDKVEEEYLTSKLNSICKAPYFSAFYEVLTNSIYSEKLKFDTVETALCLLKNEGQLNMYRRLPEWERLVREFVEKKFDQPTKSIPLPYLEFIIRNRLNS